MVHTHPFDAIANSFLSPTLPKQSVKSSCGSIRDTHHLLNANVASIKSPCGGGKNGYLGLILTATQYAIVFQVPFVRPTDPDRTPNIPAWMTPFDKKLLLHEHAKQHQQYDQCCNVDAALRNKLLKLFDDTYLLPVKIAFAGYSGATMLQLLIHVYVHYMRILATDLAKNDKNLQESYNPYNPPKSLYTRLN